MVEEASLNNITPYGADHEQGESVPEHHETPWVTYAVICLCGIIWGYLNLAKELPYYSETVDIMAPRGFRIWTGAVWGLFTAAFVHLAFWHIFFNMWCAKYFGAVLERGMGRKKYLLFILAAACVGSGTQLLVSNQTGIGFSGVVYAMFGFGLVARRVDPEYLSIIDNNTVRWLLGWLVLCIVLTFTGIMNVANGAHVGGLVFGFCVGMVFVSRSYIRLCSLVLVLLAVMTVLSVSYMPWSAQWRSRHEITQLVGIKDRAESGDPESQYLYGNLLITHEKNKAEGLSWFRKSAEQGYVPAMNGIAWMLATDPDPTFRNGTEAIELALRTCEKNGWESAAYLDTLAAAYAETDKWEEAIATQQQAVEKLTDEDDSIKSSIREHLERYRQHEKVRE